MAWPTGAISRANLDAGGDNPATARVQLDECVDKVNTMIAHTEPVPKAGGEMNGPLGISLSDAASSDASLALTRGANRSLMFMPRLPSGAWSGLVQTGDAGIIFSGGGVDTGAFVVAQWSGSSRGFRVDSAGTTFTGKLVVQGSACGYVIRRRDTAADAWELFSNAGELGIYDAASAVVRTQWQTSGELDHPGDVRLTAAAPKLIHRTGGQNVGEVAFGTASGRGTAKITTRTTAGADARDVLEVSATETITRSPFASGTANVTVQSGAVRMGVASNGVYNDNGFFRPEVDNALALGQNGGRWSLVWAANGTIQTSDGRDKTDIESIDPAKAHAFLMSLSPITFRWLIGGRKVEQVSDGFDEREIEVEEEFEDVELAPVVEQTMVDVEREVVELQEGRPVLRTVVEQQAREVPVGVWMDVTDEAGRPVMVESGETREIGRGRNRKRVPVMVPRRHFVPTLEQRTVKKTRRVKKIEQVARFRQGVTDEAGRRFHAGFIAQEVREALSKCGLDREGQALGLWIADDLKDPNSRQSLRPDQLLPIIVAAWKHQAARLEEIERRLSI